MAPRLVQQQRRGHRHVQGLDAAGERNRDERVARAPDERPEALPSAPNTSARPPDRSTCRIDAAPGLPGGSVHPQVGPFHLVEVARDPDAAGGRDRAAPPAGSAAPGRARPRRKRPASGRRRRTPPPGHARCPPPRRARPRRRPRRPGPGSGRKRPASGRRRRTPPPGHARCPPPRRARPRRRPRLAGWASACCPSARANRGACASGSGPGEPEATGTATSTAASTLPPGQGDCPRPPTAASRLQATHRRAR